jgi:hypothetical protein
VELEIRGVPTVSVVTENFAPLARAAARARGADELPIVVLPADFDDWDDAAIRATVRTRLASITTRLLAVSP